MDDEVRPFMGKYLEEVGDLFEQLGISTLKLPALDPGEVIRFARYTSENQNQEEGRGKGLFDAFLKALPRKENSTLQSLKNGRETEYEFMGGEIVRLAHSANVSVPLNEKVCRTISQWEETGGFAPRGISFFS